MTCNLKLIKAEWSWTYQKRNRNRCVWIVLCIGLNYLILGASSKWCGLRISEFQSHLFLQIKLTLYIYCNNMNYANALLGIVS